MSVARSLVVSLVSGGVVMELADMLLVGGGGFISELENRLRLKTNQLPKKRILHLERDRRWQRHSFRGRILFFVHWIANYSAFVIHKCQDSLNKTL